MSSGKWRPSCLGLNVLSTMEIMILIFCMQMWNNAKILDKYLNPTEIIICTSSPYCVKKQNSRTEALQIDTCFLLI